MTRTKIVHVVHSLEVGGLENGLVNLINRLDSERFEHMVCCLTKSGRFAERIVARDVRIIELNLPAGRFHFPLLRLARVFREVVPDIVHSRGWSAVDATFAARLARVPAIVHGEHGRDLADKDGDNWKRNQIRRLVGFNVSRYVVVCDFFRPWLNRCCGVGAGKIEHIPNGVDTERFQPRAGDNRDVDLAWRRSLDIAPGAVILGSIGRLDPVKDFPTLLKGFAQVARDHIDAVLVIAGNGPLRAQLAQLADQLNLGASIKWLGERSDVAALLRHFDLFVQTSVFEGMSNTILEAMASGLPVVATDTGGNAELVRQDRNGSLIPVGDVGALVAALNGYLTASGLRTSRGAVGRQIATAEYSLDRMAARYAELYRAVRAGSLA